MKYEFLAEKALDGREESIARLLGKKKEGEVPDQDFGLHKARILFTGLAYHEDKSYEKKLKNEKYPSLIHGLGSVKLDEGWKALFLPKPELLDILPSGSFLIRLDLALETPFFSRDDLSTYPIDNPLKREWVFGAPYLGASGVKGLLRWSYRMCGCSAGRQDEVRLFGTRKEKLTDENARQGCLYFYPLFWEGEVGFDIINPHDRNSGTGTVPIKYEVVSRGGKTGLYLLLVNRSEDFSFSKRACRDLADALSFLIEDAGISAKRSAGWGAVNVEKCLAWLKTPDGGLADSASGPSASTAAAAWEGLEGEDGALKPITPENGFTTKKIAELIGWSQTQVKKKNRTDPQVVKDEVEKAWEEFVASKEARAGDSSRKARMKTAEIESDAIESLMDSLEKNLGFAKKPQNAETKD